MFLEMDKLRYAEFSNQRSRVKGMVKSILSDRLGSDDFYQRNRYTIAQLVEDVVRGYLEKHGKPTMKHIVIFSGAKAVIDQLEKSHKLS